MSVSSKLKVAALVCAIVGVVALVLIVVFRHPSDELATHTDDLRDSNGS